MIGHSPASGYWSKPVVSGYPVRTGVVGAGVGGFAVGDQVWENSLGHGGRQGSFAQYATVPVDRLYRLPDGVDPMQAVAVAHMAATAWLGLFRHARLDPGRRSTSVAVRGTSVTRWCGWPPPRAPG